MAHSTFILLEGMSTSGKTTVMNLVTRLLQERGVSCSGFTELETMSRETFSHVDPRKSIEEMRQFLSRECSEDGRVVVCDRFHLSHLAITNGSMGDFQNIEREIAPYHPLLVFLGIPDEKVGDRILNAKSHRLEQWEDELKRRGETEEEAVEWFRGTQRKLYRFFEASLLPKRYFDTDKNSFENIALSIASEALG